MLGELTCPERFPETLSVASALPLKPTIISSWVMFGGVIEPVTTALMFTDAWRLALMLMELDPLLYKFPWPVKLTGSTID